MKSTAAYDKARAYFPRGLVQPEGSFRFSADALLLASFIVNRCLPGKGEGMLLDLGCGCGVIGLACLMAHGGMRAFGVDVSPELVAAATENAASLGFSRTYSAWEADLEREEALSLLPQGAFSVVAANMPYRREGTGRLPPSQLRRKALFAGENTLPSFVRAAAHAVAEEGSFALIYPWQDRELFANALHAHGFTVHTVMPVCTVEQTPVLCLVRAVSRAPEGGTRYENALRLYEKGAYTQEALAFCPYLAAEKAGLS